jgi:hypothetical protein
MKLLPGTFGPRVEANSRKLSSKDIRDPAIRKVATKVDNAIEELDRILDGLQGGGGNTGG